MTANATEDVKDLFEKFECPGRKPTRLQSHPIAVFRARKLAMSLDVREIRSGYDRGVEINAVAFYARH